MHSLDFLYSVTLWFLRWEAKKETKLEREEERRRGESEGKDKLNRTNKRILKVDAKHQRVKSEIE